MCVLMSPTSSRARSFFLFCFSIAFALFLETNFGASQASPLTSSRHRAATLAEDNLRKICKEGGVQKVADRELLLPLLLFFINEEDDADTPLDPAPLAAAIDSSRLLYGSSFPYFLQGETVQQTKEPQVPHLLPTADLGLHKILSLLESKDVDVRMHPVKVLANLDLVAEEANWEKVVEARGLGSLLNLLQRYKTGRSLLIDDGVLPWIVANANNDASPIRHHIELALCHLTQHEVNAKDLVAGGALWELACISWESSQEDIRYLAQCTLKTSGTFQPELKRLHLVY
ncbi:unnamed protein product [Sphagnum balticum]